MVESLPRDPPSKDAILCLMPMETKSILLFSVSFVLPSSFSSVPRRLSHIFHYVHDIKIVGQQQVFPIW